MNDFRFIDLFAGLGGFHLAAEHLGGECVFASEIDEDLQGAFRIVLAGHLFLQQGHWPRLPVGICLPCVGQIQSPTVKVRKPQRLTPYFSTM